MTQSFKEIKQEFSQQVFLKAIEKGKGAEDDIKIIGSVRCYHEKGTAFIGRLIVEPNSQNKGIGTRLMHAIEQRHIFADRYGFLQDIRVHGIYTCIKNLDIMNSKEYL